MVIPILFIYLITLNRNSQSSTAQGHQRKSGSWVVERDALVEYGDRKTRAVLAIFTARRSAKKEEFFVSPHIARHFKLSTRDLNWALDKLEGCLVRTSDSRSGKFRSLKLMPEWEAREQGKSKAAPGSSHAEDGELLVVDKEKIMKQLERLPATTDEETTATLCKIAKEAK